MPDSALSMIERAIGAHGRELECYAAAWARVVPTVLLVPAFGLKDLARPVRLGIGLVMAVGAAAAVRPLASGSSLVTACAVELARGLPVAFSAAVWLWTASMTGAVVDELRASTERSGGLLPGSESGAASALFGLFASVVFLETGGPARVVQALFLRDVTLTHAILSRVVMDLVSSVAIAVSVAAPVVVASLLAELVTAFWGRVSGPLAATMAGAPVRAIALLAVAAWLLRRMFGALVHGLAGIP